MNYHQKSSVFNWIHKCVSWIPSSCVETLYYRILQNIFVIIKITLLCYLLSRIFRIVQIIPFIIQEIVHDERCTRERGHWMCATKWWKIYFVLLKYAQPMQSLPMIIIKRGISVKINCKTPNILYRWRRTMQLDYLIIREIWLKKLMVIQIKENLSDRVGEWINEWMSE